MENMQGKKIGIFGGSFDPIHNGHLTIAEAAYREFRLDEVWFIPAGHSPNKEESKMTDPALRAQMVSLALRPYPYFKMSDMEITAEQTSYTYLTLTKLKKSYPDTTFYFIMGADSLDYFETWKHPEIICEKAVLLVAVRERWELSDIRQKIRWLQERFDAEIYPLSCRKFDAASREIRSMAANGALSETPFLPESVILFIEKHQLYKNKEKK